MKTLDQVEARTPVDAGHTPGDANNQFIINTPGSYYLTGNISGVSGKNGISITVDSVTLDLNGFALLGNSASLNGINVPPAGANKVTVRNGAIRDWGSNGIFSIGALLVEDIIVTNCGAIGIKTGDNSVIERCSAIGNSTQGNFSAGISVGNNSVISHCVATANGGAGTTVAGIAGSTNSVITYCVASQNTGSGIQTSNGCTIEHCTANLNRSQFGILVGSGCHVAHCVTRSNISTGSPSGGILTGDQSSVIDCVASSNSTAVTGTISGSTGSGINVGADSTVQHCTSAFNVGDGITATNRSLLSDNSASDNGAGAGDGAGIHVTGSGCRVENNVVTQNDRGIEISGAGNIILKNTARTNPASGTSHNFVIAADNHYGPIINASVTPITAVDGSGTNSSTVVSTDPWANFSY
ncbi:MAG: hypothetical protein ABR611_05800 [Chthoniobacterales bacterium]